MDALRHPIGPLPPSVYWRRRLLALAAIITVIVLIAWACTTGDSVEKRPNAQGQGPGGGPSATATPGASSPPPITPGPTPPGPAVNQAAGQPPVTPAMPAITAAPNTKGVGGAAGCAAATARLTVTPDREVYSAGVRPRFRVTVDNTGATPCAIDLGQAYVALLITEGADRVWNSTDCPSEGSRPLVVGARAAGSETMTWQRVRSRPGCPPGQPAAGPGRYAVEAAVGNLSSGKTYFTLS